MKFIFIILALTSNLGFAAVGTNREIPLSSITPNPTRSLPSDLRNSRYAPGVTSEAVRGLTSRADATEVAKVDSLFKMQQLRPEDFNFGPVGIVNFTSTQISWISAEQLANLKSPSQMNAFTAAQISVFTPDQLSKLTSDQVKAFNLDELKKLTPDQRAIFTSAVGSRMDPAVLAQLVPSPQATPTIASPEPTTPLTANVTNTESDTQVARDYDPDSCKWSSEIPKRIVNGPSCGRTPNRSCVGYVICNRKSKPDLKFVRMASCSSHYCADNSDNGAKGCTKDRSYSSRKPTSADSEYATKEVRDILGTPASSR